MKHEEKLADMFNIELPPLKDMMPVVMDIPAADTMQHEQEEDFQLARRTLRGIIAQSTTALDEVIELGRSTENARPYEVAGQLIKTLSEISKDLMGLHKQKKDIVGSVEHAEPPKIGQQNNIVFSGSTQDLIKMLKDKKDDDTNSKIIDQQP